MSNHDHDDDNDITNESNSTEKPDISFTVTTSESVGEPVFPIANDEVISDATEAIGQLETEQLADGNLEILFGDEAEVEAEEKFEPELDSVEMVADHLNEEYAPGGSEDEPNAEVEQGERSDLDAVTMAASEEESSPDGENSSAEDDTADAFGLKEELTLAGKIESIIFASPKPMRAVEIHELLMDQGYTLKEVQDTCDELIEFYRDRAGGFHLKYIKRMGYQFQTTPAAKPLMERQFSSRPRPLSRAALETLAVIAYRQKLSKGVTRAEVEFIRGVDAGSIFKTLVERNLLTCVGRKEIPGRPMMFGVTDEFLKVFQLGSINDLPPLESFQTPQDVLEAANQKIADFEAEQEGVDTEEFIGDEEYTAQVQSSEEFNPLAADASVYSPTMERLEEVRDGVSAATNDTVVEGELEPEAESQADLIDVLGEGQVAWSAPEVHTDERSIQGATVGEVINSLDAIDEKEWDGAVQVEMTSTEVLLAEVPTSEAQKDERDETSEVAFPAGDSKSPRGGEVDQ